MMVHEITQKAGARERRKRVGRGESSGMGRTSGRGNKGGQARAGYGGRGMHQGGSRPLFRAVPKVGFSNFHFRTEYEVVNIGKLSAVFTAGQTVDAASLAGHGLVSGPDALLKVLGTGELDKKLNIVAHAISATARAAVEKLGGSIKLIEPRDPAALAKAKRKQGARTKKLAEKKK